MKPKTNKTREAIQKAAVTACILKEYNGIVDVAPRVGKSKIAIDVIKQYQKDNPKANILITAPYNPILESWEKEFEKWKLKKRPTLINQRSLNKLVGDFDLIICDEVHTLSAAQIEILKWQPSIVLGFSGSISKDTKKLLKDELGISPIFTYSIEEAIQDKIIADFEITVVQCHLDTTEKYIEAGNKDAKFLTTEFANYQYLCSMFDKFKKMAWNNKALEVVKMSWASKRANLLYESKTKLEATKALIDSLQERALIFTARTSVADQLTTASYHSKSEDYLTPFINQEIDKLSVCEMTSMGITIPNLKIGIFHQIKSSEENSIQKVLRMCNWEEGEKAKIYIFCYVNTQDEIWVNSALAPFDPSKITFINSSKLLQCNK